MKRRAAIYARVSTEHEAQISALENQVQYYDELLQRHPELTLVDRYIDEGITGTSIQKRSSFLRMLKDAKNGRFDLIITREVSRFARNTVDTLQQTRVLKSYGVEVWFTEDNIWTMNDEDGELRLSIMATLAQNESKKISQRVKAGQMISFMNGVPYGNGNILGYDRVDGQLVVNPDQAATVKRIFELYLSGYGVRKIQDQLEAEGRVSSTGLTRWHASNINRILHNSFYCGRIEYRKQYVPDYLTQKKINNHGDIDRVYTQGTHEAIISVEDFEKAQELRKTRVTTTSKGKPVGSRNSACVWGRKVMCHCGHKMHRCLNHINKNGTHNVSYQCNKQIHTGTPRTRLKKGLSIEGICDNNSFAEWKLDVQKEFIFKDMVKDKKAICAKALEMLGNLEKKEKPEPFTVTKLDRNEKELEKLNKKMSALVDLYMEGDVTRDIYHEKKDKLEDQIRKLEKQNIELKKQMVNQDVQDINTIKRTKIEELLKMRAVNENSKVPDSIVDVFVEKIIYYRGQYTWYVNFDSLKKEENGLNIEDSPEMKAYRDVKKKATVVCLNTGSYRRVTSVKDASCFLGTFEISKDFMRQSMRIYHPENTFHYPEKLEIKLFLV
ncbi:recombinase family protein [Butyrivibrio sp. NC3005]|uniref:recombinase family protein n=1 Tax=Butyrivibrio sp. NC3005 TaxID=1280685 RepID=UPI0009DBFEE0|nr:recombinase family protein [Butyrivibrio sp. NC3005]